VKDLGPEAECCGAGFVLRLYACVSNGGCAGPKPPLLFALRSSRGRPRLLLLLLTTAALLILLLLPIGILRHPIASSSSSSRGGACAFSAPLWCSVAAWLPFLLLLLLLLLWRWWHAACWFTLRLLLLCCGQDCHTQRLPDLLQHLC
jgi:hypothetical protein